MDYVTEAKKFVQLARDAAHPDVIKEHLKMADWCLSQAVKERDNSSGRETPNSS